MHYTIGELAGRTGLPVKTIRFYSDSGLVPPTTRTPTGYRLYDIEAVARLDLVRTLRDMGVDLATVRRVLDRELSLTEVVATHVRALDAQISTLRLRRAVLRAVAKRGSTTEEMDLMHKLAKLSEEERQEVIEDFLADTFGEDRPKSPFAGMMRDSWPQLPDDPTPEQVNAWVELVELVRDESFRASVRRMVDGGKGVEPNPAWQGAAEVVSEKAGATEVDPTSAEAEPILAEIVAAFAEADGVEDGPLLRAKLIDTVETYADQRVDRYWALIGLLKGWPPKPSHMPAWDWFLDALRAHPARS